MKSKAKLAGVLFVVVLLIVAFVFFFGRSYLFPDKRAVVNEELQKEVKKYGTIPAVGETPFNAAEAEKGKSSERSAVIRKSLKTHKSEYEKINEEVVAFFDYLDQRDYVKSYKIKEGTYEHSKRLIAELAVNPPVVSGEMKDIFSILHNMSHFYRTLGRRNISLIKSVLRNEREIEEPLMDLLFQWITLEMENGRSDVDISLANLYEYAGFFLNTLAGRSYLARRDSKTRILITYYSIIILDTANKKKLNRYGIDILPHLELALDDMSHYGGLEYREKYLDKLREIKKGLRKRI